MTLRFKTAFQSRVSSSESQPAIQNATKPFTVLFLQVGHAHLAWLFSTSNLESNTPRGIGGFRCRCHFQRNHVQLQLHGGGQRELC